jgi:hypothetical protein
MLEGSDQVPAFWNGGPGGTASAIAHAEEIGHSIDYVSPEWQALNAELD